MTQVLAVRSKNLQTVRVMWTSGNTKVRYLKIPSTGQQPITVIIFVFSCYDSMMKRYPRVWLLLKQGYQKFYF